ncbi:DUF1934 domain-containing protein [Blautia liquoris]|jgi:uncharacterized beta-barrel protein YwiB (DUF1934 family)|uniref:DUF1934 domain-containing protein n=1 Tax=Blautia liquoris TaxID=2779518 RepID=A0A7M2RH97_9FIRM|nr:DUF1934 domain-containing protein [Blautia liquoris]QOV19695.1 DUF1934 domain-containing protein [Blautia liquoris]
MKKDVMISMSGLQYMAGDDLDARPVEVMIPGTYYIKNGKGYLVYDEVMEGFENKTHNIMKFNQEKIELHRKGLIDVQMIFEKNKKNLSLYKTPYGMMNMGIAATDIQVDEQEDAIDVSVDYTLDMNGSYAADCTLSMKIRSRVSD